MTYRVQLIVTAMNFMEGVTAAKAEGAAGMIEAGGAIVPVSDVIYSGTDGTGILQTAVQEWIATKITRKEGSSTLIATLEDGGKIALNMGNPKVTINVMEIVEEEEAEEEEEEVPVKKAGKKKPVVEEEEEEEDEEADDEEADDEEEEGEEEEEEEEEDEEPAPKSKKKPVAKKKKAAVEEEEEEEEETEEEEEEEEPAPKSKKKARGKTIDTDDFGDFDD